MYTLIQTAMLNGVDPQAWLADALDRIADHPITDFPRCSLGAGKRPARSRYIPPLPPAICAAVPEGRGCPDRSNRRRPLYLGDRHGLAPREEAKWLWVHQIQLTIADLVGEAHDVSAQTGADSLGSGEWQVMPGLGVRYMLFELGPDSYFVPTMRYAVSVPGNPGARRISEPQIAPTLNIDLPGPFFITFYPSHDIRINYGAPISGQTGRLFLPFDALIGARLTDKVQLSLEGSVPIVKDYPVYNFKAEARLRIVF